jgi:hypothetical protein
VGALGAGLARADVAVDSDGHEEASVLLVELGSVAHAMRLRAFAAENNDKAAVLRLAAEDGAVGRAAEGEELFALGQLHELGDDDPRRPEGAVNVPGGAGAALFGQNEGRGVEALGDVARAVDAEEEERHAAPTVALERGEAVADLFGADAEGCRDAVDVVARLLGHRVEGLVGHEERGREIVRQLHREAGAAILVGQGRRGDEGIDDLGRLHQAEDMGELKDPVRVVERFGQEDDAVVPAEGAQRVGHLGQAGGAGGDAVVDAQVALEEGVHVVWFARDPLPGGFRRAFERVEVVGVVAEEIVDRALGGDGEQVVDLVAAREAVDSLGHRPVALVELEEAVDEAGGVIGGGAEFLEIRSLSAEDGVAHGGAEVGHPVLGLVGHEIAPVDAVAFRDRHEHLHRQGPLIAFEKVHIGGTDAEALGHLGLRFAMQAAELAELGADEGLLHVTNLQKLRL